MILDRTGNHSSSLKFHTEVCPLGLSEPISIVRGTNKLPINRALLGLRLPRTPSALPPSSAGCQLGLLRLLPCAVKFSRGHCPPCAIIPTGCGPSPIKGWEVSKATQGVHRERVRGRARGGARVKGRVGAGVRGGVGVRGRARVGVSRGQCPPSGGEITMATQGPRARGHSRIASAL